MIRGRSWLTLIVPALLSAQPKFVVPDVSGMLWWKGNTHTHTTNSDGDSPPETVTVWYKNHGYNFLVLSDHNFFTDPKNLEAFEDDAFILIPGEEVTSSFKSSPVHVNGLRIPGVLEPQRDSTLLGTIQKNVDVIRSVDGIPHINHPNFRWAFDHEVLRHVRNDRLVEIFNGHPQVHNLGGGGKVSMEAIWDTLLTGGMHIYGIAVDDAHHFKGEFARGRSNPGRGWIMVRARNLDADELMRNLEAGLFYASTGVELVDVRVEDRRMTVAVKTSGDFRYTIEFIGDEGRILSTRPGPTAVYELEPGVTYVRARITDSMGAEAWVQPVWVR